ncbi:neutral zinc metallopeptidase [Prauserella oleivorans]|uniref:Neutral zinc metallopeptidase n=1 Tax=Prauserella oleivorans TaxID=1478153 RepID=A0ABW5W8E1_9PSEU
MDVAGDEPGRPVGAPGFSRPYLEDLPLATLDPQPADSPASPRRRSRWLRGVPLAVGAALAGLAVFVATGLPGSAGPDGAGGASAPPRAEQPHDGAASPGVADNRLHTAGVGPAPVGCDLPVLGGTRTELRAFYEAEVRCLDAAWRPVLRRIGAPFTPVAVELADDPTTRCGALPPAHRATGLYCDVDNTIYLPRGRVLDSLGLVTEAHVATLAHEYGHHVQKLSGILDMVNRELSRHAPGSPPDRELGRRVELQANCFAGLFLASVGGRGSIGHADAEAAVEDFRNWVDSDTHGSSRTQLRWARAGFTGGTVDACDTWSAPLSEVD